MIALADLDPEMRDRLEGEVATRILSAFDAATEDLHPVQLADTVAKVREGLAGAMERIEGSVLVRAPVGLQD